jgi:hypothetical protein
MVGNPVIMPGSYESIATTTVGAGGTATISFTSIPATYTHLQLRVFVRCSSNGNQIVMNFNSDTASNYAEHHIKGDGASTSVYGGTTNAIKSGDTAGTGGTASVFGGMVIDILDYASTNKNKTVRILNGYDLNGSGKIGLYSGLWNNTSAITRIDAAWGGGITFLEGTQIALYGIA